MEITFRLRKSPIGLEEVKLNSRAGVAIKIIKLTRDLECSSGTISFTPAYQPIKIVKNNGNKTFVMSKIIVTPFYSVFMPF